MDTARKIKLLEDLFEVESGVITPESVLVDLTWDSVTMLGLIALLKGELNKSISPDKLRTFQTIGDIMQEMD